MVAIGSPLRNIASHDHDRLQRAHGGLLDERFLRKAFSSRGFVTRNRGVVLALSGIGFLTVAILALNLLVLATNRILEIPNADVPPYRRNNAFVDEHGVPKPIFVIAGGAPRTGSTFIFNVLRVLMRIRDPNTVASSNWMLSKLVPENKTLTEFDRIGLLRTMGTSILVKLHTAKQYYDFVGPLHNRRFAEEVDLLVTGYRDLRKETVSAYKMFAQNRTEWTLESKWAEMCQALIRRRNSLITEAGDQVRVVDIRYEDWKDDGSQGMLRLIRQLGSKLPWHYGEDDYVDTLSEVVRMRVPIGGEVGQRVEWHVSNLMSPKHISKEHLSDNLLSMGVRAIEKEPKCKKWLEQKKYA